MAAGGGQSRMPTRGFVLKMAGANLVAAIGYASIRGSDTQCGDGGAQRGEPSVVVPVGRGAPPLHRDGNCAHRHWFWIARVRAEHDGPVVRPVPNPGLEQPLRLGPDNVTRVDRATNGRWSVVYVKLQASLDADGNCCGGKANWYRRVCGRPSGDQTRDHWCKVVYPDGREMMLPGGTAPATAHATQAQA